MPRTESSWWWLLIALALFELLALLVVVCLERLRRRRRRGKTKKKSDSLGPHDPKWVFREVDRLCSGGDANEANIGRMSPADRALFEVCVIDVLKAGKREDQDRLRSALIKYGYDEMCSRRVMSLDLSDRVRAAALLKLLHPQRRDASTEQEENPGSEGKPRARAAGRSTGRSKQDQH